MHLWGWGEEHHEGVEGGHEARRGDKIMKEQGEGSKKKECMKDHGVRSRADREGEGGRERAGGRSKHQKLFQNMHVHRYTYISIQHCSLAGICCNHSTNDLQLEDNAEWTMAD